MEQIKLIPNDQEYDIRCPRCEGFNYKKTGKRRGKQRYKCKDCNKWFTEFIANFFAPIQSKFELPDNISPQEMKLLDVWDLRVLGKKPTPKGCYSINFRNIDPDWLKKQLKILFG